MEAARQVELAPPSTRLDRHTSPFILVAGISSPRPSLRAGPGPRHHWPISHPSWLTCTLIELIAVFLDSRPLCRINYSFLSLWVLDNHHYVFGWVPLHWSQGVVQPHALRIYVRSTIFPLAGLWAGGRWGFPILAAATFIRTLRLTVRLTEENSH